MLISADNLGGVRKVLLLDKEEENPFKWECGKPGNLSMVTEDMVAYRKVMVGGTFWEPFHEELARGRPVYVDELPSAELCLPHGLLAGVYDSFMSKYAREVACIYGKSREKEGRWVFMIPEQTGSAGRVEWKDSVATKAFMRVATYVGTIHVHPGNSSSPSGTDTENWLTEGSAGIHFILGRNRTFSMYMAGGRSVLKMVGHQSLPKKGKVIVPSFMYSGGRPLEELLKEPKVVGHQKWKRRADKEEEEWARLLAQYGIRDEEEEEVEQLGQDEGDDVDTELMYLGVSAISTPLQSMPPAIVCYSTEKAQWFFPPKTFWDLPIGLRKQVVSGAKLGVLGSFVPWKPKVWEVIG